MVLAAADLVVLSLILWGLTALRYSYTYWPDSWFGLLVYSSGPVITVCAFAYMGLYRFVTRYLGAHGHTRIVAGVAVSVLIWSLLVFMSGQLGTPRSVILSYGIVGTIAIELRKPRAITVKPDDHFPSPK